MQEENFQHDIHISYGFHRNTPATHIDIRKNEKFSLGLSIEGKQYRHVIEDKAIEIPKQSNKGNRKKFDNNIEEVICQSQNASYIQAWLNNKSFPVNKENSSQNKNYCAYHPWHIYKYQNINLLHKTEKLDVSEKIIADIKHALSILHAE